MARRKNYYGSSSKKQQAGMAVFIGFIKIIFMFFGLIFRGLFNLLKNK
jgi:hypothetical protein